ncbi:Ribonuclease H2, subunit C [Artemisia annua]|uniref:Ribonuclease H2, subunit C n=1 Tax=Artemisia annua TaxID=35608 RepID=A0A2U1PTS5_ARTAN|nr:Ribonuclease H2, subunit C [Artemisia annua]
MKGEKTMDLDWSSAAVVDVTDEIHQVPCVIKLNGPAPVSDYFKPKLTGVEVDGLNVKEAYFRGRKLQGATVSLPHGYSGFVIGKKTSAKRKASDTDAETTDSWQANAKFQNITFWNHDNLPSKEDAFLRAFHWFDLAKALHKPVTAEDMESATNPGATTTD